MRRLAAALVACGLFTGLSPALAATPVQSAAAPADHVPPKPASETDALGWANWVRAFGENLPPLQWDEALVEGSRIHAEWIQARQFEGYFYCGTTQQPPNLVWPDDENHRVDVVNCGEELIGGAIRKWSKSPFDAARLVDPASTAIGSYCCPVLIVGGVAAAAFESGGPAVVARWPKPGGVLPGTSFYSWASVGPCGLGGNRGVPVFLAVPAAAPFGSATITDPDGNVVPSCAVKTGDLVPSRARLVGAEPVKQVAVVAEIPYTAGGTYTATIALGGDTYAWSFTPVEIPDPPLVTAAPSGPLEVTATWQPPANTGGLPITEYRVRAKGVDHVVPATQRSFTNTGSDIGDPVHFAVYARNSAGESYPASANAMAVKFP